MDSYLNRYKPYKRFERKKISAIEITKSEGGGSGVGVSEGG